MKARPLSIAKMTKKYKKTPVTSAIQMPVKAINGTTVKNSMSASPGMTFHTEKWDDFSIILPDPATLLMNATEKYLEIVEGIEFELANKKQHYQREYFQIENETKKYIKYPQKRIYDLIQSRMTTIISMITSVEAFANFYLPDGATYMLFSNKTKTMEVTTKENYERFEKLNEKLLLIDNFGPKSGIKNSCEWQKFNEVVELRNEIIHLKSQNGNIIDSHSILYGKIINLDLNEAILKIKFVMEKIVPNCFNKLAVK